MRCRDKLESVEPRLPEDGGLSAIDGDKLAEKWMVSPEIARNTLSKTTQRGIRTTGNSTLSRRFSTNDRHLRYKQIPHDMFTDTLKASIKSRMGDYYAQVLCTGFRWSRAFPMIKKSNAADALDLCYSIFTFSTEEFNFYPRLQT